MDASGKHPGGSASDLDWARLVKEMESIKDQMEQNLSAPLETELAPEPPVSSVQDSGEYAPMEEMLSGVGREEINAETAGAVKLGPQTSEEKVVSLASKKPAASVAPEAREIPESAMSLAVVGALKLRLELTRQSQTVEIHLEEAQLRVELSDGTQFRIPLNKAA